MNLYLDDDSVSRPLTAQLKKHGHQVTLPGQVGMSGKEDPIHLLFAIQRNFVLLTKNTKDFEQLHDLVIGSGGKHPGVLLVKSEQDRRKGMSPGAIVMAINKLEKSGAPVENEATVLNQWR